MEHTTSFLELYGGIAFEKQLDLYEIIGNVGWHADIDAGTLTFGQNLVFQIQLIGTYSKSSETWLWAWANAQSDFPENLLQNALQLKKYGEENGVEIFVKPQFPITENDLHELGIIASGMFDADAYYLADYGQGILLVTLQSPLLSCKTRDEQLHIAIVFPQFISAFTVNNHKKAFANYVIKKGFIVSNDDNKLIASKGDKQLIAEFDELDRMENLKTKIIKS